jgi:hypothetical protein
MYPHRLRVHTTLSNCGDKIVASEKTIARKSAPSKSRDARIAAVRSALTAYFLGSGETEEHFWNKANPSHANKAPEKLVKAGKLSLVEQ